MKTLLLLILLQVSAPQYQFKSTSSYKMPSAGIELSQETPNNPDNNANRPGPKRVSGIDGWAWWILWGAQNGVPSDATNAQMYEYYDYVQAGGTMSYQQWYDQRYNVPLKDGTLVLCLCALFYIFLKQVHPFKYNIKYEKRE